MTQLDAASGGDRNRLMGIDGRSTIGVKPTMNSSARRVTRGVQRRLLRHLRSPSDAELQERKAATGLAIKVMGITFTVYGEGDSIDRAWPFDIIPRVIRRGSRTRSQPVSSSA